MSQFRWHHTRPRRILLERPAGLSFTVDDPHGRSHHPRAYAPSRQQCYEDTFDGPMQFAFADPLCLPTSADESLLLAKLGLFAGFPPCSGPRVGHSGEEKVRTRLGAKSDSRTISFVSYFSFVSKGLESQRCAANWSHHLNITPDANYLATRDFAIELAQRHQLRSVDSGHARCDRRSSKRDQ